MGQEESVEIAEGQVVLVEAEKMAQFVEVGGADFVGKDLGIPFGKIPKVIQIENDARGRIGRMGIGLQPAGAFEEAEEVGFETLVQHGLVRNGLVKGDDRFRGGAELAGQAGADALDACGGQGMKIGFQISGKFKFKFKKSYCGEPCHFLMVEDGN